MYIYSFLNKSLKFFLLCTMLSLNLLLEIFIFIYYTLIYKFINVYLLVISQIIKTNSSFNLNIKNKQRKLNCNFSLTFKKRHARKLFKQKIYIKHTKIPQIIQGL